LNDGYFEDLELWYPVLRCREAGFAIDIAGKEKRKVYTGKYGVPPDLPDYMRAYLALF
jgi:deglycase